jgi:hypothetical protein
VVFRPATLGQRRFIGARAWERGSQVESDAARGTRWSQSPDRRAPTWDRGCRQVGPSRRKFSD